MRTSIKEIEIINLTKKDIVIGYADNLSDNTPPIVRSEVKIKKKDRCFIPLADKIVILR